MKNFLLALKKGERVSVIIIEIQRQQQLLVSYHGELLRVKNTSGKTFKVGDEMQLIVKQKEPLEFALAGQQRFFSRVV